MTILVLTAVLAAATVTSSSVVTSPSSGNFELLILHNNDMHARFEQTSQLSGTCTTADRDAGKCYGGFPRVAHVVKEARNAAAAGVGPPVLYLNAGDTYTGTAWFTLYKWQIAAEFVNALKPDAVSLGNNELEKGSDELSPFLKNLKTNILATNVILNSEQKNEKIKTSMIFELNGVKVGLIGYLTLETKILDSIGNIEYIDEVIALKDEVAKLQAQNINIIIALGHSDINKDIEIAKEVEGIDLVIGGHKNTFLWNGTNAETENNFEPIVVTQQSGRTVPVVRSYAYNKYLGQLKVTFNTDGEITSFNAEPILLDASVSQEAKTLGIITKYSAEVASRSDEVVGQTAVVLDGDSCKLQECNLGNLITDAMMYHYALRFEGERWTDAPVAIIPGGSIVASIAPSNRPASVTRVDLLAALPTESHIVAVTMTGTTLLQMLEHSVASYSITNPKGELLQFSGIRVTYDFARDSGSRVVDAVVRCWECFVPQFYTIDDWRSYKILMPASMADGEYGYSMLVGLQREDLVYDEVTCTAEYIELRSPVYPEVAGRINLLNVDAIVEDDSDSAVTDSPETGDAVALSSTLVIFSIVLIPFFA